MNSYTVFVISSCIVIVVMLFSAYVWNEIRRRIAPEQKKASSIFLASFLLYAIGQSVALATGTSLLSSVFWDVPSYAYGLAALLFAYGSWQFYVRMKS